MNSEQTAPTSAPPDQDSQGEIWYMDFDTDDIEYSGFGLDIPGSAGTYFVLHSESMGDQILLSKNDWILNNPD